MNNTCFSKAYSTIDNSMSSLFIKEKLLDERRDSCCRRCCCSSCLDC